MSLQLDHAFCFVDPDEGWREAARKAGWVLDEGIEHEGQGTRNQRLWFEEQYLEFLWISSEEEAAKSPLQLARRADWRRTGACPFGLGLRGQLPEAQRVHFWEYRPPYAPGVGIWIHRSNETDPRGPFIFVMEAPPESMDRFLPRNRMVGRPDLRDHGRPADIREIRLELPIAPPRILEGLTPSVSWRLGSRFRMDVVVGEPDSRLLSLTECLALLGACLRNRGGPR